MAGIRDFWVRFALAGSIGMCVYFLAAALGVKIGLIDWRVGFGTMTLQFGPFVLLGAFGLSVTALIASLLVAPRRGRRIALAALILPLAGLGLAMNGLAQGRAAPPIHDVSTDLADPPGFSAETAAERARTPGGNGLDFAAKVVPDNPRFGLAAGRPMAELHREAYADLRPSLLALAPEAALARAKEVAEAQGWQVTRYDPSDGRLEAVVESFWFGFKDDLVVRVRPAPEGARIDVRSVSRVGVSDLGANARRIRAFQAALARAD